MSWPWYPVGWVVVCLLPVVCIWAGRAIVACRARRAERSAPLAPVIELGPAQAARDRRRHATRRAS